ncbi:hypothetical protein N7457_009521 [Penicillium paradoxum]|uniref:uncharacterized protein n=1 Tax=Penicillium paradoxum TaxID=176176 RepID=UPI0025496411|nr:uncharacterized protein N7457_009521 [Penicillium paradoxum]KAJ5774625.1 hypothetical protein N7457_009521 [Penicillium paradoxum]
MAATCSAFPFLGHSEFESACQALADRCNSAQDIGWPAIRLLTKVSLFSMHEPLNLNFGYSPLFLTDGTGIRITKYVEVSSSLEATALAELEEPEDDDPEALVRAHAQPGLQIDYDILLSPTYQVPILYFSPRWHSHGPLGLDEVYQYVVPEQYRQELKSVGVIGGISMGYHPDSGAPAFFVHPCNTADAMAHVVDTQNVTPESYLLIWLGLLGHCVNLHVPRELFA